jgi:hypothetical protein
MSSPDERLSQLDRRVQALESHLRVAVALAVIFGLGGTGIGVLLKGAFSKAAELRKDLGQLREDMDRTKNDVREIRVRLTAAAKAELERITQAQLKVLSSEAERLQENIRTERERLLAGVIRSGDAVALRFRDRLVYIGATGKTGEVNTGMPGQTERLGANTDETFVIEKK